MSGFKMIVTFKNAGYHINKKSLVKKYMLTEKNGLVYFTTQVRSKFIGQHNPWFILEMEQVDKKRYELFSY